jgi:hypothetical protein
MYGTARLAGILVRMLAVMLLVGGTYNPGGYSFYHWVVLGDGGMLASKLCVGLLIGIGFVVCITATVRSLGLILLLPGLGMIFTLVWLLSHWGWVDLADRLQRTLVLEAALVVLLGTGVSFSLIRYRLSGQMDSRTIG